MSVSLTLLPLNTLLLEKVVKKSHIHEGKSGKPSLNCMNFKMCINSMQHAYFEHQSVAVMVMHALNGSALANSGILMYREFNETQQPNARWRYGVRIPHRWAHMPPLLDILCPLFQAKTPSTI